MKPLVVFYHAVFRIEGKPLPAAEPIIREQMAALKESGLLDAAAEFHVGLNDTVDSARLAHSIFPSKALIHYHGQQCRNELRTLLLLEELLKGSHTWKLSSISQKQDEEYHVLYFHSKGVTHPVGHDHSTRWRNCGMKHLVKDWRKCVADLDSGFEAVGTHWMEPPKTPPTQYIFAGNFFWSKASFLRTLPSIMERERIKMSGIDALESRHEAEIILGNGERLPKIVDMCPNWNPGRPHRC